MPVDANIFRRARKGNVRAAIDVMSDVYPQVYRLAHALSGRDDVGRGVVKFIMRRGIRQLPTWSDEAEPIRWSRHHTLLTTRRAARHQPEIARDPLVRGAQTDNAYYAAFIRALRALPMQQREAFILTHGEQWDSRSLGVAMDCSSDAANIHLREATRSLAALGGNYFAAFTAQLTQTYKNLSPSEELVLTNVEWNVRRHLWPRIVWRWTKIIFVTGMLTGIAVFIWKMHVEW